MKKTNRRKYRKLEIDSNYFFLNYKEKNKRTDYEGLYQDKFNIVSHRCMRSTSKVRRHRLSQGYTG